jgi:hypothetical protein
MSWIDTLQETRAARMPGAILSFNTGDRVFAHEEPRARVLSLRYYLARRFAQDGYRIGYFSLAAGFSELVPPDDQRQSSPFPASLAGAENPLLVLRQLDGILKTPGARALLLIDYADHLVPAAGTGQVAGSEQTALVETLHDWSLDDDVRHSGNFIILLVRDGALHPLLAHESGFRAIPVGLPESVERVGFARFLQARAAQDAALGQLAPDLTPEQFGQATGGLRLADIEALFERAAARGQPVSREAVRERKREAIEQLAHGLVEVIEPTSGFEAVGGCVAAKRYFASIKPLWLDGHASLPQGILLAGVPGSGKSFLIKALAKELASPCLALRSVREQWVGASERNMERVLQVVESLAPCIFWTDEVDQQVGGDRDAAAGAGDSGVSQRIFGRILEFFGDSRVRGRVLWVATTNRPDLLDTALRDRFSVKIPFLHPTAPERAELLSILAEQIGRGLAPDVDRTALAGLPVMEGLSARAMQEILVWAGAIADRRTGRVGAAIAQVDLNRAAQDYKPSYDPTEHALMALIALQMASFHSLLPWNDPDRPGIPGGTWPAYVDGLVDPTTGRLDPAGLEQRIQALRRYRQGQGDRPWEP